MSCLLPAMLAPVPPHFNRCSHGMMYAHTLYKCSCLPCFMSRSGSQLASPTALNWRERRTSSCRGYVPKHQPQLLGWECTCGRSGSLYLADVGALKDMTSRAMTVKLQHFCTSQTAQNAASCSRVWTRATPCTPHVCQLHLCVIIGCQPCRDDAQQLLHASLTCSCTSKAQ